jgi:hypothetical protein
MAWYIGIDVGRRSRVEKKYHGGGSDRTTPYIINRDRLLEHVGLNPAEFTATFDR